MALSPDLAQVTEFWGHADLIVGGLDPGIDLLPRERPSNDAVVLRGGLTGRHMM